MAINEKIPNTSIQLLNPYGDINTIKSAISKLQNYSINVENCGFPAKCESCQKAVCQACQSLACESLRCQSCQGNCNCNCSNCSDGSDA